MKRITLLYLLLFFLIFIININAQIKQTLRSPNGKLCMNIQYSENGNLTYSLEAYSNKIINTSPLGLKVDNAIFPTEKSKLISIEKQKVDSTWKPVWGKRSFVTEKYNELVLIFETQKTTHQQFKFIARVYNEGVAFRYSLSNAKIPANKEVNELTKFNFANDFTAWYYNYEHPNIGPEKLSDADSLRMPVMTVKVAEKLYLALHEADLVAGDPLLLHSKKGETSFTVASNLGDFSTNDKTAWRVLLVGKTPGELVDSHLIELLSPPSIGDFSWVKPGVAVWDWRINGAKVDNFEYKMDYPSWVRMVDFAAAKNIKNFILDANWYGPEHEATSDPLKGDKAIDVKKIIQYGNEKGVGIWLYLNDVGGKQFPIAETLKHYSEWGAAGIKYGFMQGTFAERNVWTRRITELCAQNKLLCDFHDNPVHPYGQMRTFPNAVTREFCHAQLDAHRVFQPSTFVTSVFVNMIAGPIDMNNGMFDLRQGKTTRDDENQPVPSTVVSEAARTLVVFSGATVLPDVPEFYNNYPELIRFISLQQQPWKESKTIAGEIGEYIVMARQASNDKWLVGAVTNEQARTINMPLRFLKDGKYTVTIIEDGDKAHYLTNRETYTVRRETVKYSDKLTVRLAPGGGSCLLFEKIK